MPNKAENNFRKHKDNPGPSEESLKDQTDDKAGKNITIVIIIAVIVLAIIYFLFFENTGHF